MAKNNGKSGIGLIVCGLLLEIVGLVGILFVCACAMNPPLLNVALSALTGKVLYYSFGAVGVVGICIEGVGASYNIFTLKRKSGWLYELFALLIFGAAIAVIFYMRSKGTLPDYSFHV